MPVLLNLRFFARRDDFSPAWGRRSVFVVCLAPGRNQNNDGSAPILRRSARIDHLRSPKVTHTKNTICPRAKRKTISSTPKACGLPLHHPRSEDLGKAVSRQEFIGRACGPKRSSHGEVA